MDILQANKDTPIKINSITLTGIKHQSKSLNTINNILTKPLLDIEIPLAQLIHQTQSQIQRLVDLNILKSGEITFDSKAANKVDLILDLKEEGWIKAKSGAGVDGSGSGNAYATATLKNLFGSGESLTTAYSSNIDSTSPSNSSGTSLNASFKKFLWNDPSKDLEVFGGDNKNSSVMELTSTPDLNLLTCSFLKSPFFHTENKLLGLKYHSSPSLKTQSTWAALINWTRNKNLVDDLPMEIRKQGGDSLKTSLLHCWTFDSRDQVGDGVYVKTLNEIAHGLAGFGGDVEFAKSEVCMKGMLGVSHGFKLSSSLRAGLLYGSKTRINDKFFLGGPLSLRGFEVGGVGCVDSGKPIGGDLYYTQCTSLFTPIPFISSSKGPNPPVKGHLWINAGDNMEWENRRCLPSVALGLGLVFRFSFLNLECNYSLPIVLGKTDLWKGGVGVGVGLEFS